MTARDTYELSPKHWHATNGLRHVDTDPLVDARQAVEHAVAVAGTIAFDGKPGNGKTYSIKTILEDLHIPHWYLPVGPIASGKAFEYGILKEIYSRKSPPEFADRRLDRSDLRDLIATELKAETCAVLIDDFNPSGRAGITVISWLSEQLHNRAAFVLAGNRLDALMRREEAFYNRLMKVVPFEPFVRADATATLTMLHPFLERSTPDLLIRLNEIHVRGNFRDATVFLEAALKIAPGMGLDCLSEDLMLAAIANVNKPRLLDKGLKAA